MTPFTLPENHSLDPRLNRLGLESNEAQYAGTALEGESYEVFVAYKASKPAEHVGVVHAPDKDLALLYAKDQYSRRGGNCYFIKVIATNSVIPSGVQGAPGEALQWSQDSRFDPALYELALLKKRGKHHVLADTIVIKDAKLATAELLAHADGIVSMWAWRQEDAANLDGVPDEVWATLPEKAYRDSIAYKSADKIAAYKASKKG